MDEALLVGFDAFVGDIRDRVRLCHPIIAFGDREEMYLARRLDWAVEDRDGGSDLTLVDADDVSSFGTLLPAVDRMPIEPGIGAVIVGDEFAAAVEGLGVPLGSLPLRKLADSACRVGVAQSSDYERFRARVSESVARVVDEELGKALPGGGMSERGLSASRVLRKCSLRRTDVAIRELAVPLVNHQLDLFRRRRRRYAVELDTGEDQLEAGARQHLEFVNERSHAAFTVSRWHRYVTDLAEQSLLHDKWIMQVAHSLATYTTEKLPGGLGSGKRWAIADLPVAASKPDPFGPLNELANPSRTVRGTFFVKGDSGFRSVEWDDVEPLLSPAAKSDEVLEYVDFEETLEDEPAWGGFAWQEVPGAA